VAGLVVLAAGFVEGEAELPPASVLDLLSDDAAGLDSALPPSPFEADSFPADSLPEDSLAEDSLPDDSLPDDSLPDDSLDVDSFAFFRDSDG
jgi:hypothetical protein